MKRPSIKQVTLLAVFLLCLVIVITFSLPYFLSGRGAGPPILEKRSGLLSPSEKTMDKLYLRIMTLNLAHGRKDGANQIFLRKSTIRANLDQIVHVIERERPDVVGFQEADGPSIWSGSFDHVSHIADKAGYPRFFRGEHVKGLKLAYGTALLSRYEIEEPQSITFDPSPPTPPKGFVLCTLTWPGKEKVKVDLVSLHLDFLQSRVRKKQVNKIISALEEGTRPLIIMGDFNCDWAQKNSALRILADSLKLHTHEPENNNLKTFPFTEKRFDWILLSEELCFRNYRTLPDILSDHRSVIAEVEFK